MRLDLGDIVVDVAAVIREKNRLRWKVGAPRDARRGRMSEFRRTHRSTATERDLDMDLQADKEVDLSVSATDEMGNAVALPEGSLAFSLNEGGEEFVTLTDNGDGTAVATAVGPLGQAVVHVEGELNGRTLTGDLLIAVVPGDAERIVVSAGEPREATPDE